MSFHDDVAKLRQRAQNCREAEDHFRDMMRPDHMREAKESAAYFDALADRLELYVHGFDMLRAEYVPNAPADVRMIRVFAVEVLHGHPGPRPHPVRFKTGAFVAIGDTITAVEVQNAHSVAINILYVTGKVIGIDGDVITLHLLEL